MPRPPALTGRLAWSHWLSDRLQFVILPVQRLSRLSIVCSDLWPVQGVDRRRCNILGVLRLDFKSTRASWAAIDVSLPSATDSSEQLFWSALSSAVPTSNGAPGKEDSAGETEQNSLTENPGAIGECDMISHLVLFSISPRD